MATGGKKPWTTSFKVLSIDGDKALIQVIEGDPLEAGVDYVAIVYKPDAEYPAGGEGESSNC